MPDSVENIKQQLQDLSAHLTAQRDDILDAWRERVQNDAKLQDVSQWTRAQFHDHIPFVLDAFNDKLAAWPDEDAPEQAQHEREAADAHSRHRWQQGYDMRSLVREWGHLNQCLVNEFHNYAARYKELDQAVLREANRAWAELLNECVSENVVEYNRLLQAEAATRARELEQALEHLRALEEERGQTLRTAAHDLRGGLSVVMGSASMMEESRLPEEERVQFRRMFQQGFHSLNEMLSDLMSMARLEAGQEKRKVEPFDASHVLKLLCSNSQHLAEERGLYLRWQGPETLPVEGDAVKVNRIAQNLLLNGLKYTQRGGVTLTWGEDEQSGDRWELCIEDTGPGLRSGTAARFARKLEAATEAAHDVEGVTLSPPDGETDNTETRPTIAGGEGVGLSIVKRLCELLNASMELQTTAGVGSKFRIVFPKQYESG